MSSQVSSKLPGVVPASTGTQPLFRAEVLEAQRTHWLGSISIGRQPSFTLVACVALILAAALIAFAVLGQVTRKAQVPGLLVPSLGTLQLVAAAPGLLAERRVTEGEAVQAGQVLFVLDTDRTTPGGSVSNLVASTLRQRRLSLDSERAARQHQFHHRSAALNDRFRALETERSQALQEAAFAERRVLLAGRTVERYQQLVKEGFVAELQAQAKQEEAIDLQSRAEAVHRSAAALAREQQEVRAELKAAVAQWATDSAQLDRGLAALDQEWTENESRSRLVLTAPRAGTVTALHLPLGAAVQGGQSLGTLLPVAAAGGKKAEDALEAHLYAPSRMAGFIQPGQVVWLRLAAYPYQKFGMAKGHVRSVGRTPVNPQDLPAGQANALLRATGSDEPLYRVSVDLGQDSIWAYGKKFLLKPGMALDAAVVQEARAVWEWLLEPILAVKVRNAHGLGN